MIENRKKDLERFYHLIKILEYKTGGPFYFSDIHLSHFPQRGVYFFMEHGELKEDIDSGLRIVRVGTHGLKKESKSTLAQRLKQHKGIVKSGGGNHRGSIFRLLVGTTLIDEYCSCQSWGKDSSATSDIRLSEEFIEIEVSKIIRNMPFLYLEVDDEPSPLSLRGIIEKNAIALISNYQRLPLDPPSKDWRGYLCNREKVRLSGMWNQNHVDEIYDPLFLDLFELLINKTKKI
jgi:hypothetical protein